ncbi:6262_t:CDS:2 [Paraglomus occultum]|uniref:6262_t:CDS:1 n=1 Tax=Paraglomus occultum TaxID=144539 RepID=A0A9N8ZAE6_9GLOM|nr:6262_t:CDS:2 [Paraglomus occultum]
MTVIHVDYGLQCELDNINNSSTSDALIQKSDANETAINETLSEAIELKNSIPGILRYSAGSNFSKRGQGFTHGLVVEFEGKQELEAYSGHPIHVQYKQNYIAKYVEDIIAFDMEL